MQDREMRAYKEEKFFDLHLARRLLNEGKVKEAEKYLEMAEERTFSGMNADEIDAVKERVTRAMGKS